MENKKVRSDWGFFVGIDLEANNNKNQKNNQNQNQNQKNNKPSRIMFISEEQKLKYYLKVHRPEITRSVVIIKNSTPSLSQKQLPIHNQKYIYKYIDALQNSRFILTTFVSSSLLLIALAFNSNYRLL
jgi:hypothetical protein